MKLPIDPILPNVLAALERTPSAVVKATPGSGKTTRLPPAILRGAKFLGAREVLVLEPRRLAAKLAARRVAEEMGCELGGLVGYQFRFENRTSGATRLRFLTEGMLMRRMLSDSALERVGAVILDEFHERHLHGDVALAYLRHLQQTSRPDLRIVVMSATLDTATLSQYLGDCPVFEVESRVHPIEIVHLASPPARHLDQEVRASVAAAIEHPDCGDILVFLPGMAEIRRAESALAPLAQSRGLHVLPLHGELTREQQDEAIGADPRGRIKVILSTNVAETSLTIQGVRTVIDSGLHRQASHSWWSGVPKLRTRPTSRASAIQRAGRAGRTAPGRCLRLFTQGEFSSRPPFETPEISRADLTQTVLELKRLGVREPAKFPWFERPEATALAASELLLKRLGALDGAGALTEMGTRMAQVPAHPRLARLLLEARKRGCLEDAALLAALIGEGELQSSTRGPIDALAALRGVVARDERIRRARDQLLTAVGPAPGAAQGRAENLAFSVLAAFPDRVIRKRPVELGAPEVEVIFSSGGSARVENAGPILDHELFVALDAQERSRLGEGRGQVFVRAVVPIQAEWLFDLENTALEEREEIVWDEKRKRVVSSARLMYDQLALTDAGAPSDPQDLAAAARVLAKAALGIDWSQVAEGGAGLELGRLLEAIGRAGGAEAQEATESMLARLQLLGESAPELGLPAVDGAALGALIARSLEGRLTLEEVSAMDWPRELAGALDPEAQRRLEQGFPEFAQLPGGRRVKIQYKLGQSPWIESRLQDFFGMKQGPAIAGGRIPLTLHLLAPNQRAVQVTRDLAGFWQRAYRELRGELSRRYPRHLWPDDPLTAAPPPPRPPRR